MAAIQAQGASVCKTSSTQPCHPPHQRGLKGAPFGGVGGLEPCNADPYTHTVKYRYIAFSNSACRQAQSFVAVKDRDGEKANRKQNLLKTCWVNLSRCPFTKLSLVVAPHWTWAWNNFDKFIHLQLEIATVFRMLCELCSAPERTNACVLCPPDIFPHAKTVPTWHLPTVIWYRSPLLADLTEPCLLHIFWWISKCSTCTRAKAKVQKHLQVLFQTKEEGSS